MTHLEVLFFFAFFPLLDALEVGVIPSFVFRSRSFCTSRSILSLGMPPWDFNSRTKVACMHGAWYDHGTKNQGITIQFLFQEVSLSLSLINVYRKGLKIFSHTIFITRPHKILSLP